MYVIYAYAVRPGRLVVCAISIIGDEEDLVRKWIES